MRPDKINFIWPIYIYPFFISNSNDNEIIDFGSLKRKQHWVLNSLRNNLLSMS
ncbi:hypothetical protein BML2531_15560 [Providencia rettgeri]|nr:hypothetical protein BML2531_15560 [Providencia rettgeri]